MAGSVQKADPTARWTAIGIGVSTAVAGAIIVLVLESRRAAFQSWLLANAALFARRPELVAAGAFVFLTPLVAAGVYLWWLGACVVRARRFPPPGRVVVRDTAVIRGAAAVTRGRLIQALAAVLAGCAIVIPLVLWQIARSLGRA